MNPLKDIEQLPLVITSSRLASSDVGYIHTVRYQAENGATWPLFSVHSAGTTVTEERAKAMLEAMINAYNGTLGHVHNTDECDPDGHVVFTSVCCGAQLYRCAATTEGLPSKPIIRHGEDTCSTCGSVLAQF